MLDSEELVEESGFKTRSFKIVPQSEEACKSIFINGEKCEKDGKLLSHNDRIIFGSSVFLFKHPENALESYIKWQTDEIVNSNLDEDTKDAKLA